MTSVVRWGTAQAGDWCIFLAATAEGLCATTLPGDPVQQLMLWVEKHLPGATLLHDEAVLQPYARQFEEYFAGKRTQFDIPLDLRGTPFQCAVWRALCAIPYGVTRSYASIASDIGKPTATRAVGAANGQNPLPIIVPCHRVIGKHGALTGFGGGLAMKAALLRLEGIALA